MMGKVSPAQFLREVRQELNRVTWPSRKELIYTTISVFAMSIVAAIFFFSIDAFFAWSVGRILGLSS